MPFIKNIWYVAGFISEVEEHDGLLARLIIGEPVVIWRDATGKLIAMEDRCPHRQAPLSAGRLEGDTIQCMYHGLKFSKEGKCQHVPGTNIIPPNSDVLTYPVAEKDGWIWVWLGEPSLADKAKIPDVHGEEIWRHAHGDAIVYEANYELVNDNLTDLSHVDFVHETTLGAASANYMSNSQPDIQQIEDGLLIQKWVIDPIDPDTPAMWETWSSYRYLMPGLFLAFGVFYPIGTAEKLGYQAPPPELDDLIMAKQLEQQAVTPMSETQTRYMYTTNFAEKFADQMQSLDGWSDVLNAAFAEDRVMIEAQQRILNVSDPSRKKAFIPQDKAPTMFRKMIQRRLDEEAAA